MTEGRGGSELTPREPGEVEAPDSALTPVEGESRGVERFSAGPRAHSVSLTEERSAQIVRSSANARNIVFLAVLFIALFIPVYWFYESGIPALGTGGRLEAEAETQYVTDVARGYELYLANCAECHGDNGEGGVGPPLNSQPKLYNALTPAGDPGTGHLNPNYLHNVLNVGGRYVCGDPDSLMAAWQQPAGPLNYRQVEELIAWLTASQDVVFERHIVSHGAEGAAEATEAAHAAVSGWRDPTWTPAPDATPVPACWRNPSGLIGGSGDTTPAATTAPDGGTTAPPPAGGTPDAPRVIHIEATSSLEFVDESGTKITQLEVVPGETVQFVVDNTAGFDHNFYIGTPEELQVPFGETATGIPTWQSGEQTLTWTVPEEGLEGLQFACTVPGHYQSMHGDIVVAAPGPASEATDDGAAPEQPAEGGESAAPAEGDGAEGDGGGAAGTADSPRTINLTATAALSFTGPDGAPVAAIEVAPGETVEFVVENTAGFDHNFWIGTPEELQVPFGETDVGIGTWQTGTETVTWTAPESGGEGLQFACTVPGHYQPMHGDIVITG
jgi:uncharacterized cupredoxin-like copper-binding protein/mono/diheme cytochrome c family protein